LDFSTIKALAEAFDTSQTATAIRLVESDHSPSMLVCHGVGGRKWFARSPSVPDRWFPQEMLDAKSFAFAIQFGNDPDSPRLSKIGADAWFDRAGTDRFELQEQTIRSGPRETLTLLVFCDAAMLEDEESWRHRG
jgi:hypothetical protein